MPLCPATPRTFLLAAATLVASAAFPCEHTVDGSYCWNPAVHGSFFGSVEGDVSAPNAKGSFEGAVVGIPAAHPGGVFASPYSSRVDPKMTTARTLLIYVHELGTPDMYSASAKGQLGASTRYDYLNKMANEERQWYAVNSGGKMDATYTIVDSGEIGYEEGTTPWSNPFKIVDPILSNKGLKRSDYDFVQLVWDDMRSGTYVKFETKAGGQSNRTTLWSGRNSQYHEIGHNLGFNHANDLSNTSLNTSLYDYDFVTKTYVPGSSTSNSMDVEIKPITVGVIRNEYGSPVDLMGDGIDSQYGARDKQTAGWLTLKQIGRITPGLDGSVSNIAIHNPAGLVVVTDGNVLPGQEGATGRYGVERGYADVPYAATFVRKAQRFLPNATGDGGKWESYAQLIDLNYRQITPSSVGIELRVDGAYLGVIQKGQKISEKDFAQFLYIESASPWVSTRKSYDLVNDLKAPAPDNPNRYRSTWYDIEYTDTGSDSVGEFANLRITHHAGSTPVGRFWAGGSGDWDTTTAGWLDLDNGNVSGVWAHGLDATFGTPVVAAVTVTVSGKVSPASLTFKPAASGVYTISGGAVKLGAGGLNAEDSANIASDLDFDGHQVWEIIAGKAVSVTGTITDNKKRLEKIGLGELALNASQTLWNINIYEGVVSQGASQTLSKINVLGHGEYVVKGGTLMLKNFGDINGELGFPSALRLARTDSTTASPELEFLGNGWISAELLLDAGQHVIRTNPDFPETTAPSAVPAASHWTRPSRMTPTG